VRHFGLHGRVSNEPASAARWAIEGLETEQPVMRVRGQVRQAALYSENFTLTREIEIPLFASVIYIRDTVRNEGWTPAHHEILYHWNFGYPLVDRDAVIALMTTEGLVERPVTAPVRDGVEEVTNYRLAEGSDGRARAAIRNPKASLEIELTYAPTLEHFSLWYMMAEGVYAVGFEPTTVNRFAPRPEGTREMMSFLEPGEQVNYDLALRISGEPSSNV
jgi:hypothetical protein